MLLTVLALTAQPLWAASTKTTCVVIHETEGTTAFALEDRPVVSFAGTDVQLQCGETTVHYPLAHYLKMTIEEAETTTVLPSVSGHAASTFIVGSDAITVAGPAGTDATLALYAADGKCLASAKPHADGTATLSTRRLTKGVYIVSFGDKSFKINR